MKQWFWFFLMSLLTLDVYANTSKKISENAKTLESKIETEKRFMENYKILLMIF